MLLQQLNTFCRVVEEGSFTRAAAQLNLSQPAVTKQVAALEESLETELIQRTGKHLTLTAAGDVVYHYAKRIERLVLDLHQSVQELQAPDAGHITIGAVLTIGLFTLPDILADYSALYPAVKVHVRTGTIGDVVQHQLHHELDIGLVTMPVVDERILAYPLFDDPVLVVCAPRNRLGVQDSITLGELGRLPLIGYQKPSRFRASMDQVLEECGIRPNVTMEFDSHEAVKTMVALGFGLALVPASAVREEMANGKLAVLRVDGLPPIRRTTTLLVLKDRPHSPAVDRFVALTVARFQGAESRA